MNEHDSKLPSPAYFEERDALALLVPRAKVLAAMADAYGQPDAAVHLAKPVGIAINHYSEALAIHTPLAQPVLYVSPEQLAEHSDDGPEHGRYLPARKTPAGKFTQPLYAGAAPAAVAGPAWGEQQVHALAIHMATSAPPSHKTRDYDADMAWARSALGFIAGHAHAAPALEAPAAQDLPADEFRGDTPSLVRNIIALLELDAEGALVPHGVGGHARGLLSAAAARLAAAPQAPAAPVGQCVSKQCADAYIRLADAMGYDSGKYNQESWYDYERAWTMLLGMAAPAVGNWIAAEEVDRLVRDLDVALHGEADAAPQASLCDIVGLAKAAADKLGRPVLAAPAAPAVDAPALGEWVATLEVDSGGGLDYETVPPCTLPPGCYRLYRAAQAKEGGAA